MHWLASERLKTLVAGGKLTCGHVGVLWFLVDHMDKTGHAWVTPTYLAQVLGRDEAATRREVKKLVDLQLVARTRNPRTGQVGYMVNPYIAHVGSIASRQIAWGRFKAYLTTRKGDQDVCTLKPDTIGAEVDLEREQLQAVAA